MTETVLAWHCLGLDGIMRSGAPDGTKPRAGATYALPADAGEPIICRRGFSALRWAVDAISHAAGPLVCRLRLSGQIVEYPGDRLAASTCEVLAGPTDATRAVCAWAGGCVEYATGVLGREDAALVRESREAVAAAARAADDPRWWAVRAMLAAHAAAMQATYSVAAVQSAHAAPGSPEWHAAWRAERARQNAELEPRLCALLGIGPAQM